MRISDPEKDGTFLFSRKNIVGVIVAALIVVAHLIYGLGVLWPVVAVAGWGAAVLLVPDEEQSALAARQPGVLPPDQLNDMLNETVRRLYAVRPPREIEEEMTKLRDSLRWLLNEWDALDDAPEQQMTVTTMVREFMPGLIDSYLGFPDRNHPQAVSGVVESLQILRAETEEAKQAIIQNNVRQLEDHTRTLRLHFGRMPGLQSSDDQPAG